LLENDEEDHLTVRVRYWYVMYRVKEERNTLYIIKEGRKEG